MLMGNSQPLLTWQCRDGESLSSRQNSPLWSLVNGRNRRVGALTLIQVLLRHSLPKKRHICYMFITPYTIKKDLADCGQKKMVVFHVDVQHYTTKSRRLDFRWYIPGFQLKIQPGLTAGRHCTAGDFQTGNLPGHSWNVYLCPIWGPFGCVECSTQVNKLISG
jgi:hypothetical protein